jgi:hypothetical protein
MHTLDECSEEEPIKVELVGSVESIDYETDKLAERDISIIEFAIINNFLFKCLNDNDLGIKVHTYGISEANTGRISFGGGRKDIYPWWFSVSWDKIDDMTIIQTRQYLNGYGKLCNVLGITTKNGLNEKQYDSIFNEFKRLAYNNSEYKGKVLKITLYESRFEGIEILNTSDFNKNIILNATQKRFVDHFITSVMNNNTCRFLFNGKPGSGKTESIRKIMFSLLGNATFVIPNFYNSNDLLQILESCAIFDPGVIVIDDVDIYLANRTGNGGNGNMSALNSFLQFFDGIKKNKISVLASTNSKDMVDSAAERPGRFNMILDFGYLDSTQIEDVCNLHLETKWQIKEVYDSLRGNDELGNKINVTGAFIANLSHNLNSMSESIKDWTLSDTLLLIKESYRGFYGSQLAQEKKRLGFNRD